MTRYLPVANPQNRFSSTTMEYELEDNPGAPLEVYEDHSRTILSSNTDTRIARDGEHGALVTYEAGSAGPQDLALTFSMREDDGVRVHVVDLVRRAHARQPWPGAPTTVSLPIKILPGASQILEHPAWQ